MDPSLNDHACRCFSTTVSAKSMRCCGLADSQEIHPPPGQLFLLTMGDKFSETSTLLKREGAKRHRAVQRCVASCRKSSIPRRKPVKKRVSRAPPGFVGMRAFIVSSGTPQVVAPSILMGVAPFGFPTSCAASGDPTWDLLGGPSWTDHLCAAKAQSPRDAAPKMRHDAVVS